MSNSSVDTSVARIHKQIRWKIFRISTPCFQNLKKRSGHSLSSISHERIAHFSVRVSSDSLVVTRRNVDRVTRIPAEASRSPFALKINKRSAGKCCAIPVAAPGIFAAGNNGPVRTRLVSDSRDLADPRRYQLPLKFIITRDLP